MTLIQFDDASGRRIGSAVRFVEDQANRRKPLTFVPVLEHRRGRSTVFRVCTFTGSWGINTSKVVTFKNQTSTPNTVAAFNLFFSLPDDGTKNCAIGKEGSDWYLLQWEWVVVTCSTATT